MLSIVKTTKVITKFSEKTGNKIRQSHHIITKSRNYPEQTVPNVQPFVRYSTRDEIKEDEKAKQTKSKFPKFVQDQMVNMTKIANVQYDGWSMTRALNSFNVDIPKNLQNVRDCLTSLQNKMNVNLDQIKAQLNLEKNSRKFLNCEIPPEKITRHKEVKPENPVTSLPEDQTVCPLTDIPPTLTENPDKAEILPLKSKTLKDQMVNSASGALNAVWGLSSYLPNFNQKQMKARTSNIRTTVKKNGSVVMSVITDVPCMDTIERRAKFLVYMIGLETEDSSLVKYLMELSDYLVAFPKIRSIAVEHNVLPNLLELRQTKNLVMQEEVNKVLSLVGHSDPPKTRGVKVLAMDGGGMRALISLEILKQLEEKTNKRVHEMFDYICGVSTGSLLGVLTCINKMTLEDAEEIYRKFSKQIFGRSRVHAASSLVLDNAYYDTKLWQSVLYARLGEKSFVDTMMDPTCPKISVVSTLVNVTSVQNFLFRNYNHQPSKKSAYLGSVEYKLWEAIRASSAAPWYFEEFKLGQYIHQDGGLMTNNPAAIALHESRLVWPDEEIQCIVSIGTGKHKCQLSEDEPISKSSLMGKVAKIVESATDTEGVHTILKDTLPSSTYFRFNPPMSEPFGLDEIDEKKWVQMKKDATLYCKQNQTELDRAAQQLLAPRNKVDVMKDMLKGIMF